MSANSKEARPQAVTPFGHGSRRLYLSSGGIGRPIQTIALGGQHEVATRQSVDLVRPDLDAHLAPGEMDVGVMTFLLGESPYPIGECKRGGEIGELVVRGEMMTFDDAPGWVELGQERLALRGRQRRNAAAARHARLRGECRLRPYDLGRCGSKLTQDVVRELADIYMMAKGLPPIDIDDRHVVGEARLQRRLEVDVDLVQGHRQAMQRHRRAHGSLCLLAQRTVAARIKRYVDAVHARTISGMRLRALVPSRPLHFAPMHEKTSLDLSGKVALITGASRGIGAETALPFGLAGPRVALNYNRGRSEAEELRRAVEG